MIDSYTVHQVAPFEQYEQVRVFLLSDKTSRQWHL